MYLWLHTKNQNIEIWWILGDGLRKGGRTIKSVLENLVFPKCVPYNSLNVLIKCPLPFSKFPICSPSSQCVPNKTTLQSISFA